MINGYCSVLGSCVTMILSISAGFALVLLTGAVIYGAAALFWPERELRELN